MELFSLAWWPLGALVFSFVGALIIGFNHWAQLESRALLVARLAGVAPLALLSFMLLPWPTDAYFYAAAATMGVLLAGADFLLFRAAAQHGGRLAALYVPLKMLLAFVGWLLVVPAQAVALLAAPVQLGLVLVGFALAGLSLGKLRAHDASWAALLAVAPVAAIFAGSDIVAKYLVPPLVGAQGLTDWAATLGGLSAFLFCTNLAGALVGVVALRGWPQLTPQGWGRAAGFGALLYLGIGFLLVVVAASPNPGYVAAITMLSALWLAIWARYKLGEANNLWAGLGLLAGAMLVALGGAG